MAPRFLELMLALNKAIGNMLFGAPSLSWSSFKLIFLQMFTVVGVYLMGRVQALYLSKNCSFFLLFSAIVSGEGNIYVSF